MQYKLLPPHPGYPVALGYGRVSDIKQFVRDISPETQADSIARYVERQPMFAELGVTFMGTFLEPKNASAFKKPFQKRVMGASIYQFLRPGDHLIVDKLDRIWRTMNDFVKLFEYCEKNSITIHLIGEAKILGKDMNCFDRCFVQIICAIAEMDSRLKGQRVKASIAYKKSLGTSTGNNYVKPGYKLMGGRNGGKRIKRWIKCERSRNIMRYIEEQHDQQGMTWRAIAKELSAKYECDINKYLRSWSEMKVSRWYAKWQRIKELQAIDSENKAIAEERKKQDGQG